MCTIMYLIVRIRGVLQYGKDDNDKVLKIEGDLEMSKVVACSCINST